MPTARGPSIWAEPPLYVKENGAAFQGALRYRDCLERALRNVPALPAWKGAP